MADVASFLNPIPHVSFVEGEANIDYLKRGFDALVGNPLFAWMEFSSPTMTSWRGGCR